MTAKEVQLSVTLPIGMHEQVRDLAQLRSDASGETVTMGEIYSAAIGALTTRLDAGEDIVFASHPKGGVRRASIRVDELAARQSVRRLAQTRQSSFVATAVRHYLKSESEHG